MSSSIVCMLTAVMNVCRNRRDEGVATAVAACSTPRVHKRAMRRPLLMFLAHAFC